MASAEIVTFPGFTDVHVHPRDFAQNDKEDFETCSQAAIAGGVTTFGAMPNYEPEWEIRPYTVGRMENIQTTASGRIYCDVGHWASAQPEYDNVHEIEGLAKLAIGFKFYVEPTQGQAVQLAVRDFEPQSREIHRVARDTQPIAAHVEDETIEDMIGMVAQDIGHTLYIPHVNSRFMMETIMRAQARELPVKMGTTTDYLFMTEANVTDEMGWYRRMKPFLGTQDDQDFLWANIAAIDCFETDHAPHTREEKDRANQENPEGLTDTEAVKCYGTPGLESMLPLLVNEAVNRGRITFSDIEDKLSLNPRRMLGLPKKSNGLTKVKLETYEFGDDNVYSKCGWTPYAGRQVTGRVVEVQLRDRTVYHTARPGREKFIGEPRGQVVLPEAA